MSLSEGNPINDKQKSTTFPTALAARDSQDFGWRKTICGFQVVLLLVGLAGCATRSTNEWRLAWQDEFNGDQVDPAKWDFVVNARGGGNNELQYYITNNAMVRDGALIIEARQETYTGAEGTRNSPLRGCARKTGATGSMAALRFGPNSPRGREFGRQSG